MYLRLFQKPTKYIVIILLFMAINGCGHVPVNKQKASEICDKEFTQRKYGKREMYSLIVTDRPAPGKWTCFFTGFDIFSPNYEVIIEVTKENGHINYLSGK